MRARNGARRAAAGCVAAILVALTCHVAPVAGGALPAPDATGYRPPSQATPAAVTFAGRFQTPWVTRDGTWQLSLAVDGAPPGSRLKTVVHQRVSDRQAAVAAIYTDYEDRPLASLPDVELDRVPMSGGARQVDLAVTLRQAPPPESHPGWEFFPAGLRPGVYPVDVRVVDGSGAEQGRIVVLLTRVPDASEEPDRPKVLVSTVIGIGSDPSVSPDGLDLGPPAARDQVEVLADALESTTPRFPLTLVPRPETIEALARDEQGRQLVDRIDAATDDDQVVSGAYVDIPLAAWADSDLVDEVTRQRDRGLSVLQDHLDQPDFTTWSGTGPFTARAAAVLWPMGVRTVILDRGVLGGDAQGSGPYSISAGGDHLLSVVQPDSSASDALTRRGDPVLDAASLAAELALIGDQAGAATGVTVVAPEDWPADARHLEELSAVLTHPEAPVTPVTVAEMVETVAPGPTVTPVTPMPVDLGEHPDRLREARRRLDSYTSLVGPDDREQGALDQRLLLSGSEALSPEETAVYVESVISITGERFEQVQAPTGQTVTLTSSEGKVPLTIENHLSQPVTVEVVLQSRSRRLSFGGGDHRLVELPPGSTSIDIPVRARVPGDSVIEITVRTPDGRVELEQVRYTVRSTAVPWVGLVLSGGAMAFLALWWGRHLARARRGSAAANTSPDTEG